MVDHPARTTWAELAGKGRRTAAGHARLEVLRGPVRPRSVLASVYSLVLQVMAVLFRSVTRDELVGPTARLKYLLVGLRFRAFWFVELWRCRIRLGRSRARGGLRRELIAG